MIYFNLTNMQGHNAVDSADKLGVADNFQRRGLTLNMWTGEYYFYRLSNLSELKTRIGDFNCIIDLVNNIVFVANVVLGRLTQESTTMENYYNAACNHPATQNNSIYLLLQEILDILQPQDNDPMEMTYGAFSPAAEVEDDIPQLLTQVVEMLQMLRPEVACQGQALRNLETAVAKLKPTPSTPPNRRCPLPTIPELLGEQGIGSPLRMALRSGTVTPRKRRESPTFKGNIFG